MVSINNHNNAEYACNYIHKEISSPEVKRSSVDIPLRDGSVETTGFLSAIPHYGNRQVTVGLELRALRGEWPYYYSQIMQDIHGQTVEVVFEEDPEFYWYGVAAVGVLEDHKSTAGITITVDAQPFKRRRAAEQVFSKSVSGDLNVTFQVSDMRAYPTFLASAANMTVTVDGDTYTLPLGEETTIFGMVFTQGSHTIALHGAGTITMKCRGGML